MLWHLFHLIVSEKIAILIQSSTNTHMDQHIHTLVSLQISLPIPLRSLPFSQRLSFLLEHLESD